MKRRTQLLLTLAALLVVGVPGYSAWVERQQEQEQQQVQRQEQQQAARARYEKAEAMFQERCKKAGVFIYRTAENVEGIFLLKIRPDDINFRDQYKMDDPYGHDSSGENYFKSFFYGRDEQGALVVGDVVASKGYRYADAIDPKDDKRYRYTGRIDQPWLRDKRYGEWVREFVLDKVPAPDPAPRYGVTYDDISMREERD